MSLKEQLIGAIKEEDNEKVSDVLEQMCVEEVNEKDEYGETALYKACRRKNNQAVSLLLAKPGINVNIKNSYYVCLFVCLCGDSSLSIETGSIQG